MQSIYFALTLVAVLWLAVWSIAPKHLARRYWWPFDMHEDVAEPALADAAPVGRGMSGRGTAAQPVAPTSGRGMAAQPVAPASTPPEATSPPAGPVPWRQRRLADVARGSRR